MEDLKKVGIMIQRFGAFHGQNESDPVFRLRTLHIRKRSAEHQPRRRLNLGMKNSDLIERDFQSLIRQIFVFYVNRDSEEADVTGLEFGEKIGGNDVSAPAIPKKTEW